SGDPRIGWQVGWPAESRSGAVGQGVARELAVLRAVGRREATQVGDAPSEGDVGDARSPAIEQVGVDALQTHSVQIAEGSGPHVLPEGLLQPAHADTGDLGEVDR